MANCIYKVASFWSLLGKRQCLRQWVLHQESYKDVDYKSLFAMRNIASADILKSICIFCCSCVVQHLCASDAEWNLSEKICYPLISSFARHCWKRTIAASKKGPSLHSIVRVHCMRLEIITRLCISIYEMHISDIAGSMQIKLRRSAARRLKNCSW
jgi:hypothetical protein